MGIEPTRLAWKARALPLSYTRKFSAMLFYHKNIIITSLILKWSGWGDLNSRPLGPKPSALPNYATPRSLRKIKYSMFTKLFQYFISAKSVSRFCR